MEQADKLGNAALELLLGPQRFTDLHFVSNQPAMMRRGSNEWVPVTVGDKGEKLVMSHEDIVSFVHSSYEEGERLPKAGMPKWLTELHQRGALHHACTLGRSTPDGVETCRVRLTIQIQTMREEIALVMRPLKQVPKRLQDLGLPPQVSSIVKSTSSGLIVVTGPTGSGKSTTLATMINELNEGRLANILTLEDPIEFQHERQRAIVNQRELGVDFVSFESGVRDALRFVPDVIMIGETRDANTMRAALRAAESGHMVITSMHAPTTVGALRKMISYLSDNPGDVQALAGCLVAVVAQALIRTRDQQGNSGASALAFELLDAREAAIGNAVSSSVFEGGAKELTTLENNLRAGQLKSGMPLMQSIRALCQQNVVDPMRAAIAVSNPADRSELLRSARATPPSPAAENARYAVPAK